MKEEQERRDFFISYTGSDQQWAEWIAFQLEGAGHTLFLQAWDFRPGANFVGKMDYAATFAERILVVLSPAYLRSDYVLSEWATAFLRDPKGKQGKVLPVRIEACEVDGLLGPIVYIDLVSLDEMSARERLLEGVQTGRGKPGTVVFPGSGQKEPTSGHRKKPFPGPGRPWLMRHPRNPLFTGREHLLTQIAKTLGLGEQTASSRLQIQALSGLGGIGKTQLAVEYAHRHYPQDYRWTFWTDAASENTLTASFIGIARFLNLPFNEAQKPDLTVRAVLEWLEEETGWLLILDNLEDLKLLGDFLPPSFKGHVLLTTRMQAFPPQVAKINVGVLEQEAGALLLLRRAGVLKFDEPPTSVTPASQDLARTIAEKLGGLPLALDLAGAYIQETSCSLSEYLKKWRSMSLLEWEPEFRMDYTKTVATTWSLAFDAIKQNNTVASSLLCFCTFLAPSDAIPLFRALKILRIRQTGESGNSVMRVLSPEQKNVLSEMLQGEPDQAIRILNRYSLLQRDDQYVSLHRLVQEVLRNRISREERQLWELCSIQVAYDLCPGDVRNVLYWEAYERWLPQALACVTWISKDQLYYEESAYVLHQAGDYLYQRGPYPEAESLLRQAINIYASINQLHPRLPEALNTLANVLQALKIYEEAEKAYQRALDIVEKTKGLKDDTAMYLLKNLANLYRKQHRYSEAEIRYAQASTILSNEERPDEERLRVNDLRLADLWNEYGSLYFDQQNFERAEVYYQQALAILAKKTDAPLLINCLDNLATVYYARQEYQKAEPFYKRSFEMSQEVLGNEHPTAQLIRVNYARCCRAMEDEEKASQLEQGILGFARTWNEKLE